MYEVLNTAICYATEHVEVSVVNHKLLLLESDVYEQFVYFDHTL